MSTSFSVPSEGDWLLHKADIRRWYLVEKKSLEQVRQILELCGLIVTKDQLGLKLKQWGFQKNLPQDAWRSVDHRIVKRERLGKQSGVSVSGVRLEPAAVRKGTNRYRKVTLQDKYVPPPTESPRSPGDFGVTVYTPPPICMEFKWPETLPWLKFQSILPQLFRFQPLWHEQVRRNDNMKLPLSVGYPISGDIQAYLSASLGAIMPEAFEGELYGRAETLLKGTSVDIFREKVAILIFRLSNNHIQADTLNSWEEIAILVFKLGLVDSVVDFGSFSDVTILAFAECLFGQAVYWTVRGSKTAAQITEWLLRSGQKADCTVTYADGTPITTIELALNRWSLVLLKLLINHGIDLKKRFRNGSRTALELLMESLAIWRYRRSDLWIVHEMAKLLIAYGVHPNPQPGFICDLDTDSMCPAVFLASRYGDLALVKLLVDNGASVTLKAKPRRGLLSEETVITFLVSHDYYHDEISEAVKVAQYLLEIIRLQDPETPINTYVSADSFIAAIHKEQTDFINVLYAACPDISVSNAFGITPLHAACTARAKSLGISLNLLSLGANACSAEQGCPPPLHLACFFGNYELVKLLIKSGVEVNKYWNLPTGFDKRHKGAIMNLFRFDSYEEARDEKWAGTPLRVCLAKDRGMNQFCARILIANGAYLEGYEVSVAARGLQVDLLRLILAKGGDPNQGNGTSDTPLQLALRSREWDEWDDELRRLKVVGILLDAGAAVQRGDASLAVKFGCQQLVDMLLRAGGGPITVVMWDLELSILRGDPDETDRLLEQTGSRYHPGALCAAAAAAVRGGRKGAVEALLRRRRPGLPATVLEATAVGISAFYPGAELVRLILDHLELPNSPMAVLPSWTPETIDDTAYSWDYDWYGYEDGLNDAIDFSFWRSKRYLLGSPLIAAIWAGNVDALSEMLRHGLVTDQVCLCIAVTRSTELMELLVAQPGRIRDGPRAFQGQALLRAIVENDVKMTRLLLKSGVDINFLDRKAKRGRSPLQAVVEEDRLELMDILIEAGADVNTRPAWSGGATALQIAAAKGQVGVAKRLLELGADINAPPGRIDGRTALEAAAEHGRIDVIQLLLEHGVETQGRHQRHFIRAIQLATREGHAVAARFLMACREWTPQDEEMASSVLAEDAVEEDEAVLIDSDESSLSVWDPENLEESAFAISEWEDGGFAWTDDRFEGMENKDVMSDEDQDNDDDEDQDNDDDEDKDDYGLDFWRDVWGDYMELDILPDV